VPVLFSPNPINYVYIHTRGYFGNRDFLKFNFNLVLHVFTNIFYNWRTRIVVVHPTMIVILISLFRSM